MNNHLPAKSEFSNIPNRIEIIQVLRGVAVIMVMIFHLKEMMKPNDHFKKELDFLFASGPAGVDLFFIISGFIMVYITRKSAGGLAHSMDFLVKRIIRVWPLYIIATLSYTLILFRYTIPSEVIPQVMKSMFFIPLSHTNPPFFGYAFLPVGWSLVYEMYFYLIIAISILSGRYRWISFTCLIILTLILVPFANGVLNTDSIRSFDYGFVILNLITNPIIWDFVYGVIIGILYISPSFSPIFYFIFSKNIVVAVVVTLSVWQYLSGFYGGHGPLNWGFGMGLLCLALIFHTPKESVQYPEWLIHLGNMSYSIYLWHIPVAGLITYLFNKISLPAFYVGTPAFFLAASMTLIISHISYKTLEVKLHAFLVEKIKPVRAL
ncbi:acyltransferase [Dyadobacter sp. CY345]|uniref:acyltransferase family protein n=1 Tax=Dyadobacter sp. CY345 TaxID=2909335 RepID=UPI001F197DAC|nr:acyltransferase [Dyadobacter sp. CY345]MCF2445225.1 acyltransferase [Dyadobacter sp. CY345]